MRALVVLGLVLTASPAVADPPDAVDFLPPPPLTAWSMTDAAPAEVLVPAAWTVAAVGGASSLGLTVWGLGTALSDLASPSGPPVAFTAGALAWSTVLLAVSGLALDYALTSSAPSGPE